MISHIIIFPVVWISVAGETYAPFQMPAFGSEPFHIEEGTNPFLPVHPATHVFANEFGWSDGASSGIGVDLNVDVLDKKKGLRYPWHFDFTYNELSDDVGFKYGHVVHPTNKNLKIPFDQFWYCLFNKNACGGGQKGGGQDTMTPFREQNDNLLFYSPPEPEGEKATITKDFLRNRKADLRTSKNTVSFHPRSKLS